MKSYLSIDAGGTFLKSAVLNTRGEVFQQSVTSTKSFSDGPKEQIFRAFGNVVQKAVDFIAMNNMTLNGIGIAFPGPFNFEKATPLMHHKFQSLYEIDLRKIFYSISGVPADIPVKFMHDANAVLAGELWKGNAQGYRNAAVVTLGTGLGFAVSIEGKVLQNNIGGPFLSIFQLPFQDGILEDYVSQRGFLHIYNELIGSANLNGITVSDLGRWAATGEENSRRTFHRVGEILGASLKVILGEMEIECLLFGGQISRSFSFMEEALRNTLGKTGCLEKIDVVKSIDYAAFWGTINTVLQND